MAKIINNQFQIEEGYLYLPAYPSGQYLPELTVDDKTLYLKDEFHVSLIKLKNYSDDKQKLILQELKQFNQKFPIDIITYSEEYRLVNNGKHQSIIQMCSVQNWADFERHVNDTYQPNLLLSHPTHVTLYTEKSHTGIGLNSSFAIEENTVLFDRL